MSDDSGLGKLKDYLAVAVGAVTVFYVCGYLVHVVLYRLLGVEFAAQPLDYLKLAGDYTISIIVSIPQLVMSPSLYFSRLWESPLIWATIGCLLSALFLVASAIFTRARTIFRGLALFFTVWSFVVISVYEIQVLNVKNVLQPFDAAVLRGLPPISKGNAMLEERVSALRGAYDDHLQYGRNTPGFDMWTQWFNPISPAGTLNQRGRTYLALLFLNILLLILVIVQRRLFNAPEWFSHAVRAGSVVAVASLITLFPFVYATVGRVFTFPVVQLELEVSEGEAMKSGGGETGGDAGQVTTHPVYLFAQNDNEVIVYDRLNFFQIKHVPRSKLLGVKQLFYASPFDGCQQTQGVFTPCEVVSWKENSQPISDF
jgi:hypothetical protein